MIQRVAFASGCFRPVTNLRCFRASARSRDAQAKRQQKQDDLCKCVASPFFTTGSGFIFITGYTRPHATATATWCDGASSSCASASTLRTSSIKLRCIGRRLSTRVGRQALTVCPRLCLCIAWIHFTSLPPSFPLPSSSPISHNDSHHAHRELRL